MGKEQLEDFYILLHSKKKSFIDSNCDDISLVLKSSFGFYESDTQRWFVLYSDWKYSGGYFG